MTVNYYSAVDPTAVRQAFGGRVAAEATSLQEILALVAAGRRVCLVPSAVAQHHPRAGVTFMPIADADPAVVSLARRRGPICPAVKAFIEASRQLVAGRQVAEANTASPDTAIWRRGLETSPSCKRKAIRSAATSCA